MEPFKLSRDEGIVLRASSVAVNAPTPYTNDAVLTNQNIIVIKKGIFGNVKDVEYYPLDELKIINNKPQALVGKHRNGTARLEAYFQDGSTLYLSFNTVTRMMAQKWATEIQKQLVDEEEDGYSPAAYAIPGTERVAETLKGTMDTFKTAFNKKTAEEVRAMKRPVYCQECGAKFEGISGRTVKCPYCDTPQYIR